MNETYVSVSTSANIIQSVMDVLAKINPEYIEIPEDAQEIANDIQAVASKKIGGNYVK